MALFIFRHYEVGEAKVMWQSWIHGKPAPFDPIEQDEFILIEEYEGDYTRRILTREFLEWK